MLYQWIGSPHFTKGRELYKPVFIVIHIMVGTLAGTDKWFNDPKSKVSSHYGVGKGGEIHQYVKETDTAYHAGEVVNPLNPIFKGKNPNQFSIGIEHEGGPKDAWTESMKFSSAFLICDICERWQIPIKRSHVIGHYEIKSTKPNCPAENKKIIDELVSLAGEIYKIKNVYER